jgi:hypothetical protein
VHNEARVTVGNRSENNAPGFVQHAETEN